MYRSNLVLFSILLSALSVSSNDNPLKIRQTANGPVEGIEKISSLGQKYYSFRGIPYAEAPITGTDPYTGEEVDRRFKAPEPLKRQWTEPLKVHDYEKTCPQSFDPGFPVELSKLGEDCLFLNIYVPAGGSVNKTVIVWIHGGGFKVGDATENLYGPDFLLSQDNIVVAMNYRLGIFGFLNLNFGEYTGNMGLKDQQLALKWVHENIEHFSGNKSEILLFGESAGGASVHFHMLNKVSRSYFQRAFAASGTAFNSHENHVKHIQRCSKLDEMSKLIEYLKTENSNVLISCAALEAAPMWEPVIESNKTKNAFLTKTTDKIYNDPIEKAPNMDAMFSFTAQEVTFISLNISLSEGSKPLIKENVMETTNFQLPFRGFTKTAYPKEYEDALKKLRKAYFSDTTNINAIRHANNDLLSDSNAGHRIIKATAMQAHANKYATKEMGPKNTFLFRFNVTADLNLASILDKRNASAANHLDDLCYLFHCHYLDKMNKYDKHLKSKDSVYDLIMRSVKMITNFARTGDPSIEGDTPFKLINPNDEFYCQEVANELNTSVTHDIQDQLHYDVWHEIDEIYKSLGL